MADYNARQRSVEGRAVCLFTHFGPAAYYHPPAASQESIALGTTASGQLEARPAPSGTPTAALLATGDSGIATLATSDAGAATLATSDAGPNTPSLAARFKVQGVMTAGATREAVLVGPDGRSMVVSKGSVLPSTYARVVAIDDRGLTLVDRGPDGSGPPTEVRLQ